MKLKNITSGLKCIAMKLKGQTLNLSNENEKQDKENKCYANELKIRRGN